MKIVMFYHTLLSDWNHGNAHFLRGVATELAALGHQVDIYEPRDSWSLQNLLKEHGDKPIKAFQKAYPLLDSRQYSLRSLKLDEALEEADLVIVHEWSDHSLVKKIGEHRKRKGGYHLLFHDTHHRMVTDPESMAAYDLSHYDGVLAYGRVLKDLYLQRGAARRAWVWHEAADTRVFKPVKGEKIEGDLLWVGNWGDEERTAELHEFILKPVTRLGIRAQFYGVRYPGEAKQALAEAGIRYGGWLANFEAPAVFGRHKVTVHVPRRPYVEALPGIPTIRPFEALACGIPLVCSPWNDSEKLFKPGKDFLIARTGAEMERAIKRVLNEPALAEDLAAHGLATIQARHTCAHRVQELLEITEELSRKRQL